MEWEPQDKGGPPVLFAGHVNGGVVLLQDLVHNGQAQPGAFRFGGEEGIEDLGEVGRRDAAAGVHNVQGQVPAAFLLVLADGAFDPDAASLGHGLQPVQQQVDQDLLNLVFVKHDLGEVLRLVQPDLDSFLAELGIQQGNGIPQHPGNGTALQRRGGGPGKIQHPLHQALDPVDAFQGVGDDVFGGIIQGQFFREYLDI